MLRIFHFILGVLISILKRIETILTAVYCRFPGKYSKIKFGNKSFLIDTQNVDGLTKILLNPSIGWEINEAIAFSALSKHSTHILDIGANLGIYSIMSSLTNPNAEIYGFEPNPINAHKFKANVSLNSLTNVRVIEKAVGQVSKKIDIFVPIGNSPTAVSSASESFTRLWHKQVEKIEVNQISIDDFVQQFNLNSVNLIKIDVENYELEVLIGAKELLITQHPAILMEVHIYEVFVNEFPERKVEIDPQLSRKLEEFMISLGYYIYVIGSKGLLRVSSVHSHPDSTNYIFSKYESKTKYLDYLDESEMKKIVMVND